MLTIQTENIDGFHYISLVGEVDMYVAPRVRDVLLHGCENCDLGVAIDLGEVCYMDSSGIATLIEGLQWKNRNGGRFVLVGVRDNVLNTLKLAKLDNLFEICASREEALKLST